MKNLFKRIITTILVLTMVMGFNVPFSATTVMAKDQLHTMLVLP